MINTAIILAGGFGTRLQSVIKELPKPMAPINNIPFLNYQLNYLKHYGIKNIIFSTGFLAEKIKNYYNNNYKGLTIVNSHETNPLGTGGGIRLAINNCSTNEVLVLNGDSFFDVNLFKFYTFHAENSAQVSLALREVSDSSRYGTILKNKNHSITSFKEKNGINKQGLINGGVYILNKEVYLKYTPLDINFSIEKDFFEKKVNELAIFGFEFNGYFIDIGIPDDYKKAQNDFKEFKYK